MHKLELRTPPPIVAGLVALGMWFIAHSTPTVALPASTRVGLVALLATGGLALILAAVLAIVRAGTTIDPRNPSATRTLVCTGVYRLSRNPIYLGDALLLAAWAAHLSAPLALLGVAAFVAWVDRFQIVAEERALHAKFAQAFSDYRRTVRRWI